MRSIFLITFFLFFLSCSEPGGQVQSIPKSSVIISNTPNNSRSVAGTRLQKECEVEGEILEENILWLKDQGQIIYIRADSATYDPNFGMSHRILEVYDSYTCERNLQLTLPVNLSPDFPYYLADINYNNNSKMVAIKAAKTVYCLDLTNLKMLPVLLPKYKNPRLEVDPSSGMIIHLELWENFLIGYAQDKGTFVFDLSRKEQVVPVLPFAELQLGGNRFHSLFLLPTGNNHYQAIIPLYDWGQETFTTNALFEKPKGVERAVSKSALNNRFLVLRQTDNNKALVIDMLEREERDLPPALSEKSTKEILEWLKK